MLVLTVDQSTKVVGIALGDSSDSLRGGYEFGSISMPKNYTIPQKLGHLLKEFDKVIKNIERHRGKKPDLVAIEKPFFPVARPGETRNKFNPETIAALQRVAGVVTAVAAAHGIPVVEYTPEEWRHTVLGFSRAGKQIPEAKRTQFLKKAVANRMRALGYVIEKDDESDALGLLVHAHTGAPAVERAQGDLLDRISI